MIQVVIAIGHRHTTYNSFLKRLLEDLGKAEIAANSMEKIYDYCSKQSYKIIKALNDEINSLQNDRRYLLDGYTELHSMQSGMPDF